MLPMDVIEVVTNRISSRIFAAALLKPILSLMASKEVGDATRGLLNDSWHDSGIGRSLS